MSRSQGDDDDDGAELLLEDMWSLYHHHTADKDWNFDSYHLLTCMSSAEEFWAVQKELASYLAGGMFFLMREHVFPCWDDPNNISGGCISVKVPMTDITQYWQHLASSVLSERLGPNVTGISCSPRHSFCIFKVWTSHLDVQPELLLLPRGYIGDPMFKSNRDNIRNDQERSVAQVG